MARTRPPAVLVFLALIALGVWTPTVAKAQQTADLLLMGGRVFTADSTRPWAEAVAIRGDRIIAVGADSTVARLAGEGVRRIDLGGLVVVPGLTDAHVHPAIPTPGALELFSDGPPDPGPDAARLAASLRNAIDNATPGQPIVATIGSAALDDSTIDREWLDRIAPDNPVRLAYYTGHGMIVNSAALRAAGLREDVADPPGGRYGRDPATGLLDGRLYEYAIWNTSARLRRDIPRDSVVAALRRYAERKAAWGVTAVHTMGSFLPLDEFIAALDAADAPLRWSVYPMFLPKDDVAEAWTRPLPQPTSSRVRIAGMKWILDGAPPDRLAAMRAPYADRPGTYGVVNFEPDAIRSILRSALDSDQSLALHVAGDSTTELLLRTMEGLAPAERWRAARVRIEHGDGLTPDLIPLAHRLGVVVTQNPLHLADTVLAVRLGPERRATFQPLSDLLRAGVPLALGSDTGGGPPGNPWLNIMLAVRAPSRPDQALSPEQAVLAYTRGGAFAEGRETNRGTLGPGMLADLAVLSDDPFQISTEQLPGIRSVMTLLGGRVVHDAGVLPTR